MATNTQTDSTGSASSPQASSLQAGYGVPIAIVVAGLLIAGAVLWSSSTASETDRPQANTGQAPTGEPNGEFRLPNESDHVRGNRDAKVAIIEFSDFECPFCARIHPTLARIIDEDKDVKWIFRHFPLSSHSRAFGAAVASECIAKLGSLPAEASAEAGNDAFWNFAGTVFSGQRKLGNSLYEELARNAGIDTLAFNTCTKDQGIASEVQADLDEVIDIGGRGTPFVVVVTASGKLTTFSGALPYEQIKSLVDQAYNN